MSTHSPPSNPVKPAVLGGDGSDLEMLELRRRKLQLEAEALALEEQIARSRAAIQREAAPAVVAPVAKAVPVAVVTPAPRPAEAVPPAPPPPAEKAASSRQAKASNTQAATSKSADAPEKEQPPPPQSKRLFFIAVPSWLVSMVVHMIALMMMAMMFLPQIIEKETTVVMAAVGEPSEELIAPQEVKIQLETTENVAPSLANTVADLGATDLGASLAVANAVSAVNGAELEVGQITEVGALFGTSGKGMSSVGQGSGGAEFFGVKASGNRFVFIVDSSNSMRGDKFKDAREELMYAIRRLSSKQYFYVIFFDHDAARMTFAPNKTPEAGFANATAANIKKVEDWVNSVENELKTDPYDAVVFALTLYPDAIYILTDGIFTDKGKTEKYLDKNNKFVEPGVGTVVKTNIHTVGFYDPAGESILKRIAEGHKGTYRFVPKPKKK